MFGISSRVRRDVLVAKVAVLLLAVTACAHTVSQDKATGPDGKVKGAKPMTLENGEARAFGIVTYPGGDRTDWKTITLPDKGGSLDVKLSWTPARPGMQLGFDIFDQYNYPVAKAKGKRNSVSRTRRAHVDNARGKYYIRVYALSRGDAGKYKLHVAFSDGPAGFDLGAMAIPDPPRLAAIPTPLEACDDTNFDPKKPTCKAFCPAFGAPTGWPACAGKCNMTAPSADVPDCRDKMPCPEPPDRRVKACTKDKFAACDPKALDPKNPNCDNYKPEPINGRIVKSTIDGSTVEIWFAPCASRGIDTGWKGKVMRGSSGQPLSGGEFTVTAVSKNECRAKVRLSQDTVSANLNVRVSPP